jgi:hypothetical protein
MAWVWWLLQDELPLMVVLPLEEWGAGRRWPDRKDATRNMTVNAALSVDVVPAELQR